MEPNSKSKMRVLVTGASGKVAQRIVPLLVDKLDLKFTDLKRRDGSPEPLHLADLMNVEQACQLMTGMDAVLHMAIVAVRDLVGGDIRGGQQTPEQRAAYEQAMLDVNIRGTYNVFEAARRTGVKKVVFCSSILTVLGHPQYTAIDANTPPRPMNVYGCTKLFGEHLGELYSRMAGLSVICLRLGEPYPGIYPWENELLAKPLGRTRLVGVEDVAQAVECALRATNAFGVYYVLSRCSAPLIDVSASAEIGYRPRVFFTDDGQMITEK